MKSGNEANPEQGKGFILYGPPGGGKTSVIEAFIHELMEKENFRFLYLAVSDIMDFFMGVLEKKVNAAFGEAIDNAPCVIFIDDLDNICVSRAKPDTMPRQKRLTEAFIEAYDLLKSSGKQVVFIGATAFLKEIDRAILERVTLIEIPLPNIQAREKYFACKLENAALDKEVTYLHIAEKTDGYSFRDLNRLTEELMKKFEEQSSQENYALDAYRTEEDAAAENGQHVLTKSFLDEVLENYGRRFSALKKV